MKNVLLASTAVLLSAGVASADITFSGGARFGVLYDSTAGVADELALHNRFTLNIDGTAETDSGVEFFARVRVRGGNSGTTGLSNSGVSAPRVGMSFNGVEVAVGNIKGAIEETPGLYDGAVGLTGLGDLQVVATGDFDSFSSNGAGVNGAEVIYSAGAFGAHLSHSPVTDHTAAHVSYGFGDWTVAAAYQDGGTVADDTWLINAGGSFGNFGVGASYGDTNGNSKVRLNGSAAFGTGTKVTAFVADDESVAKTIWGLGFTHSLGGATLAGGLIQDKDGANEADLGVRFSF